MLLASKFKPKYVLGLDIDEKLIKIANKNKKYYYPSGIFSSMFPLSIQDTYGPLEDYSNIKDLPVHFQAGNFLDFNFEEESFDTLLALSITKWIHLNWGDEGILNFFRKCYNILCSGGVLFLEFQLFSSYRKKRNIHKDIRENYDNIKLKPKEFKQILLDEIKFTRVEELKSFTKNAIKFERPFYAVYK